MLVPVLSLLQSCSFVTSFFASTLALFKLLLLLSVLLPSQFALVSTLIDERNKQMALNNTKRLILHHERYKF